MNKNKKIQDALMQVYDPEFPVIDIYTLGLIYKIDANEEVKKINILMTLTSPACPLADMILNMTRRAIQKEFPDDEINIELTFEPLRKPDMIKDEDLKRLFE